MIENCDCYVCELVKDICFRVIPAPSEAFIQGVRLGVAEMIRINNDKITWN
jgi:hypothetical protein